MFKGKTLLITGVTGSFGNAVLERVIDFEFNEIRIFSRDEKKQDDMRHRLKNDKVKFYIGDVRDRQSVDTAMKGVHYVFHAAALKQVPSCEFFPMEAIKTNCLGTNNVLESAIVYGAERVVVLSTDKAAYPINAMGISKAMMEKIATAKGRSLILSNSKTIICCTRYGNVMASRGSVIPLWLDQINHKKAITITDPEMTRFMMTLEDAVDLVLFAWENGENGDLFVQKAPSCTLNVLAESIRDLLKAQIEIQVIGTRHGEKVYETLVTEEEMSKAIEMDNYYRIPCDARDLNYQQYFTIGENKIEDIGPYHSHNTNRLDKEEMKSLLLKLPLIKNAIKSL